MKSSSIVVIYLSIIVLVSFFLKLKSQNKNNSKYPKFIYIIPYFILFFPKKAFAYLDPGSSSALIGTLIAAITAGLYFLKSVYYKYVKKSTQQSHHNLDDTLLIFSEGNNYWGTFRPIVHELIKQKVHFRYITLDLHDCALTIENEFMHSRLYTKSLSSYTKITKLKASVMLSTTPNIGTEGFPLARPSGVRCLVHVFHAMDTTANYRLGALDKYDSVIMVGKHEKKYIRNVEQKRNIREKELVALGLPYLDDLYHQIPDREPQKKTQKTILIAPSWGTKGCFNEYGIDFIKTLAKNNFNIIIRLHPQSYITEVKKTKEWENKLKEFNNIIWDKETIGSISMHKSDILISDTSSIRFDYAFLYSKPVITLDIPKERRTEFESQYYDTLWADELADKIGVVINQKSINNIIQIINETVENFSGAHIKNLRETYITNFSKSAPAIVDYLKKKITSKKDK